MSGAMSNALVEGCSGALGSVIALLATYPLKTIYTLQALSTVDEKSPSVGMDAGSRLLAAMRFLQTYKLSTLYAGLGPNVVESALSSGVYFYFYSKLRDQAVSWARTRQPAAAGSSGSEASRSRDVGVLSSLLVATAAGALNQLITMPASVVATKMQGYQSLPGARSGSRKPPTTLETIATVFRENGLAGFWKGLLPSMILLVNPAVQYMLFERLKALFRLWKAQRLAAREHSAAAAQCCGGAAGGAAAAAEAAEAADRRKSADSDEALRGQTGPGAAATKPLPQPVQLSALEVFLAGALAKIGATIVTYPLIVVKARLQASAGSGVGVNSAAAGATAGGAYRASTWGVISDTARNEGLGGFFKGLRAKILQTALNAALMLMLKEQLHGVTKKALSAAAPSAAAAALASAAAGVTARPS